MGVIDDILKALDRIPGWTRIQQMPDEVDGLKKRITTLEELLSSKHAPEFCRYCGARASRLFHVYGSDTKGNVREEWTCGECNRREDRFYKPFAR